MKVTVPQKQKVISDLETSSTEDSIQNLIIQNVEFAKRIAKKFYRRREYVGIDEEDFIAAAYLGLCDAAGRFDPQRGQSFQTFSFCRIRGAMYDLLRQGGTLPRHYLQHLAKTEEKRAEILSSSNVSLAAQIKIEQEPVTVAASTNSRVVRRPALPKTAAELASFLSVADNLNFRMSTSKDNPEGVDLVYLRQFCTEDDAEAREQQMLLLSLMNDLPAREKRIIYLRYFVGLTFDDMKDEFNGASKSWISRLHGRGLDRLRMALEKQQTICDEQLLQYAA